MKGKFYRDASDRRTYKVFDLPAKDYAPLKKELAEYFQLQALGQVVTNSLDIAFQDFRRDVSLVSIEWDNWSGFTVVAKNQQAEPLLDDIAHYLEGKEQDSNKSMQATPNGAPDG